jgi:hypothetical protein
MAIDRREASHDDSRRNPPPFEGPAGTGKSVQLIGCLAEGR